MAKHKAVRTLLCLAFLVSRIVAADFNPFQFLAKLPKVSLVVESKAEASNYDACTSSSKCWWSLETLYISSLVDVTLRI